MDRFYPEYSSRFAEVLPHLAGRPLVVIGHARPDGDCIGAQIALARLLRARGLPAVCANPDPVPRRLQFLTHEEPFHTVATLPPAEYHALYVDCADAARAGEKLKTRFAAPIVNIDHHLSNQGYAAHNFVDVASAATCEILAGILLDNELPIDATMAQALYTGILTDTGQFRFNSTTRRTFLLAAELMARGANPVQAGHELYERETAGKLQLLQRFLASLRLECGGRVCVGTLPDGIFAATGATLEDTEGLVDYARAIDGVEIGVLLEERGGGIKGSLRAKDPAYRVDQVAARFNGGGHACAAGLNYAGATLAEFQARLVSALEEQIAAVDAARALS
ncbi:MAG TPA: bifunctional oligoribonuclease/PAP phosphatase NrnA [Candidatus Synoicihabitans sp.]|nr:bifunctional oligoribonuclease/PAP phosphatase NrnA [Candidatus Synoicihabitans sp.]